MQERVRTYAGLALLVFVLGGLLAPLMHDVSHAFAWQSDHHAPVHFGDQDVVAPAQADVYDCELCEVLLTATTTAQQESMSVLPLEDRLILASSVLASDDAVAPQSRAPPVAHV